MDKGYDGKAADIWSAGVILYVLLAGCASFARISHMHSPIVSTLFVVLPFEDESMVELFRKIVRADPQYPQFLSKDAIGTLPMLCLPPLSRGDCCDRAAARYAEGGR